jgi:hypothetical protein
VHTGDTRCTFRIQKIERIMSIDPPEAFLVPGGFLERMNNLFASRPPSILQRPYQSYEKTRVYEEQNIQVSYVALLMNFMSTIDEEKKKTTLDDDG